MSKVKHRPHNDNNISNKEQNNMTGEYTLENNNEITTEEDALNYLDAEDVQAAEVQAVDVQAEPEVAADSEDTKVLSKLTPEYRVNTNGKLDNVKPMNDVNCAYHVYIEDYVYTYLYQYGSIHTTTERSAALIGEIYNESKEVVIKGAIPINPQKLTHSSRWINLEAMEEVEDKCKKYFDGQQIIGWMHLQPGYGTLLTANEQNEHFNVFDAEQTVCILLDTINKIETVFVSEDGELKEQSGYFIYHDTNEDMQQFMLDYPFTETIKEQIKDDVVNQFREIGKMRKEEYNQKKNLNFTVIAASVILIALTIIIVRMNKQSSDYTAADNQTVISQGQNLDEITNPDANAEVAQGDDNADVDLSTILGEDTNTDANADVNNVDLQNNEVASNDNKEAVAPENKEDLTAANNEVASTGDYDTYVVKEGDTLANICYEKYKDATKSVEVKELNGLASTDQIFIGQELKMPKH